MTSGTFFHALRRNTADATAHANPDLAHAQDQERLRHASVALDQNAFYNWIAYGLALIAAGSLLIVAIMI
jgi:hypothetical protein